MTHAVPAEFDQFAAEYQSALRQGLDLTGESPDYFAGRRVEIVKSSLERLSQPIHVRSVLDFGCGTGGSLPALRNAFPKARLAGCDLSEDSLSIARKLHAALDVEFITDPEQLQQPVDLVFCNGVFHHILPGDRPAVLQKLRRTMTNDARFAFWENNPWNPGTRLVMSRIAFDRDAQTLSVFQAGRLLASHGFCVERDEHCFWFPRSLALLRPLESLLRRIPFGGQYLCLARKSTAEPRVH